MSAEFDPASEAARMGRLSALVMAIAAVFLGELLLLASGIARMMPPALQISAGVCLTVFALLEGHRAGRAIQKYPHRAAEIGAFAVWGCLIYTVMAWCIGLAIVLVFEFGARISAAVVTAFFSCCLMLMLSALPAVIFGPIYGRWVRSRVPEPAKRAFALARRPPLAPRADGSATWRTSSDDSRPPDGPDAPGTA